MPYRAALRAVLLVAFLSWSHAAAQEPFVYPAKGQSAEQQSKDMAECHVWAVEQTGFDPATAPVPPQTVAKEPEKVAGSGSVLRGAARGAIVGTAAGAIAGDAGKGAAIGAATGGLVGGMRRADQVRSAPKSAPNPEYSAYQERRSNYQRARKACLSARGYTVE